VQEGSGDRGDPDGVRARVAELERRVRELEGALARQARSRRNGRLVFLVGIALYVLFLSWELTRIV